MWEIRAEREEKRYSAFLDGERVAHAAWALVGDLVFVPHVRADALHRNAGVGMELARGICDDARESGMVVVAACEVMRRFAYLHPRYEGALRAAYPGELAILAPLIEAAEEFEERLLRVF
ncbi:MAG TPA: N-acetyltransferase [Actinospica sp.]|jgi:predicted GNAT family acetyltransferase|nr:N-acetyltransferase [Actinospica sp.]